MSDDEMTRDDPTPASSPDREASPDAAASGKAERAKSTRSTDEKASEEKVKLVAAPHRIYLVPYPKFVFMYPTLIIATIAAVVMYFAGYRSVDPDANTLPVVMTGLFLVVLAINTFVIVFDFPRATSLTLVFVGISLILGAWILIIAKPEVLPFLGKLIATIRPVANASFFACIAIGMLLMFIAVFIKVRFDYWELSNNELLHHHGFLSDLKRYPAPNLRVDKEINDVFEYLLLGAGRLILHPSTEKRSIVLDNILFVSEKERELTKTLGAIKVKIGGDSGEH